MGTAVCMCGCLFAFPVQCVMNALKSCSEMVMTRPPLLQMPTYCLAQQVFLHSVYIYSMCTYISISANLDGCRVYGCTIYDMSLMISFHALMSINSRKKIVCASQFHPQHSEKHFIVANCCAR